MDDRNLIDSQQKSNNQNEFDQMQFHEQPEDLEKRFCSVGKGEHELQHLEYISINWFLIRCWVFFRINLFHWKTLQIREFQPRTAILFLILLMNDRWFWLQAAVINTGGGPYARITVLTVHQRW